MPAIGILGGMGPQASAHLHTLLINNAPKFMNIQSDSDFPEIIHISVSVPNFVNNPKNMEQAKIILQKRVQILEEAGSIVNGIACNTAHLLLPELQETTHVPFVSLPQLVSDRLVARRAKRVGLLATPSTLKSKLYDNELDESITLIKPDGQTTDELEVMIRRRLKSSPTNPEDTRQLHKILRIFTEQERLDAVVLGCTELPLIFGKSEDEQVIDCLEVLSEGLLKAFVII